ncbi:AMP-binding protein [Kocuria palustris]|uniref:AMP-binding protein n=1 Tax=Kocuria palustris TaxID=71999 RepID=UPI0011A32A2F|nr:AMP-binding protein [Kocuria palustris]
MSLRETIAHLPPEQRERVAGLARHLPPRLKLGPVFRQTQRDIRKARTIPSWGREERDRRLQSLLDAAAGTDYYGSAAGYEALRDRRLPPMQRLSRLPILTREELSENSGRMLTVPESRVEVVSTSGSSGEPIVFRLDRARGAGEWAYVLSAWDRAAGYDPRDWRLRLRGAELPGGADWFVQGSTGEVVLRVQALGPERVQEQWGLASQRGIRFLHGFPSALTYLARLLETELPQDEWRHEIRGLLTVSEELTTAQTEVLDRAFPNARIANFYGLSERTCFAPMDERRVFHPEPLYGVAELVDEAGRAVGIGERGRLVTTGLRLTGQPFLRYDTGDSAERAGTDPWGRPTFREIRSRRGREGLVRRDGSLLPATLLNITEPESRCVRRLRIRQDEPGRATLLVEQAPGSGPEQLEELMRVMRARLGRGIEAQLELVDALELPGSGKERLIEQNIPGVVSTWA